MLNCAIQGRQMTSGHQCQVLKGTSLVRREHLAYRIGSSSSTLMFVANKISACLFRQRQADEQWPRKITADRGCIWIKSLGFLHFVGLFCLAHKPSCGLKEQALVQSFFVLVRLALQPSLEPLSPFHSSDLNVAKYAGLC